MGHGWRLDGLSAITRCPKTIVQDGVRRDVALTAEDQFCLDGQRLLMVPGGTHGAAAEYRLQIDSFSKVLSFGSDPAKGPDRFEVHTKRGWIMTYGQTADATIEAQGKTTVLTWALSQVRDRRGNYYAIQYTESNNATLGEYQPERIRYTGNLGSPGTPAPTYNVVKFVYEDRPDKGLGFVAGSRVTRSQRLTAVRAYTGTDTAGDGGTLARDYRVAYTTNAANGRSLVQTIRDCDGVGNCLPATTFTWTTRDPAANTFSAAGSGNWGGPQVAFQSTQYHGDQSTQLKTQVTMGDFDGDGMPDLARGDDAGVWQVCLARSTQFQCQTWSGPGVRTRDTVSGDFNGDGRTDIAVFPQVSGTGNWNICLSTGTGFSCSNWVGQGALPYYYRGRVEGLLVGDFNGDGRDDIAIIDDFNQRLCKSTGSGFEGGACQTYPGAYDFVHYARLLTEETRVGFAVDRMSGDINGDGRADYVQYVGWRIDQATYPAGSWMGIKATDTGFVQFGAASTGRVLLGVSSVTGAGRFTDLNGDPYAPLSDLVTGFIENPVTNPPEPHKVELCRSNGTGLANCQLLSGVTSGNAYVKYAADMDGDGGPDLVSNAGVCQLRLTALGAANADTYAYECSAWTPPTIPSGLIENYKGDFNGDGRLDQASYIRTTDTTGYWQVNITGHGGYVDLLATVVNGAGLEGRFTYSGLHDTAVYTPGSAVSWPKQNAKANGVVVTQLRTSNAQGGWLATNYQYAGKRTNLDGRGDLGFEVTKVTDAVKQVRNEDTVSQEFPYIGMSLASQSRHVPSNVQLASSTNTLASFATAASAVHPYVRASETTRRDLDNSLISVTTKTIPTSPSGIDPYGNVTDVIETVAAGGETFSTRTVTQYTNQTSNWLLGLPTRVEVTKSATQTGTTTSAPTLALSACSSTGPTMSPATAVMTCTLANTGQTAATSISYSAPAGTTPSGPTSCSALTPNCGTVTVTSGTAPATYSGSLTATPTPSGTAAGASVNLVVQATPPALSFTGCSSTTPTTSPTAANLTCTLRNDGQTTATSVAYASAAGTSASGPGTCAGGSTNCGTVTVTSSTNPGSYSGTLSATPTPGGSAASTAVSLVVNASPPALALASCNSTNTTSPAAATMTCTLRNDGQTAASSVSYATAAGTTVSGPGSCSAGNPNCGTVTVTSGTSPAAHAGTLSATPTPAGTAGNASVNLTVSASPPALSLVSCSSTTPTTSPTAATMTCTLRNDGQTAASSVSYATAAGTTVSGPGSCAASSSNCGSVTVTSGTGPGSYGGSLSATPTPAGSAGTAGVSLVVNATPPALALVSCSSTTPTTSPTAATMTCTLRNDGQTAASSVSYASAAGTSASGPGSCSAGNPNCGTVTVTSGTSPAPYAGTLSATPTPAGSAGSAGVNLTVNPTPPALSLTGCSSNSGTITPTAATMTCTLGNSGQTAASSVSYGGPAGTSASGPSSCAAGNANCGTVTLTSGTGAGTYAGTLTATPSPAGSGGSAGASLVVYPNGTTLSRTPSSLSWSLPRQTAGTAQSITVTNTGAAPTILNWTYVPGSGGLTIGAYDPNATGTTCSKVSATAPGASCVIAVRFTSACTPGTRTGTLSITGSSTPAPAVTVSLSGTTTNAGSCI